MTRWLLSLLLFCLSTPAFAQEVCPVKHPALTALDHDTMARAYDASFRGIYGRNPTGAVNGGVDDREYWISVSNHYGEFGDNICRAGWNAYWEQKLTGQDSVDPKLGDQPARFQPSAPPPVVTPPPPPPPPIFSDAVILQQIALLKLDVADVKAELVATHADVKSAGDAVKDAVIFFTKYIAPALATFLVTKQVIQ